MNLNLRFSNRFQSFSIFQFFSANSCFQTLPVNNETRWWQKNYHLNLKFKLIAQKWIFEIAFWFILNLSKTDSVGIAIAFATVGRLYFDFGELKICFDFGKSESRMPLYANLLTGISSQRSDAVVLNRQQLDRRPRTFGSSRLFYRLNSPFARCGPAHSE